MMKKIIITASLSSVLLFSGCTIPFIGNEETPTVSTADATSLSQENPEQLFFDFAKASGAKTIEKMNEAIPDKEILIINEGTISIDGDFNMEGTPMGGGTGTFALKADVQADYSDETNPLLSEKLEVKIDALGGLFKVDGNGEFRVANSSIFLIVNALDFNIPMVDKKAEEVIQKFIGQWYGNSFDEIKELADGEFDDFDFNKMFAGSAQFITAFNLIEDISTNPENHISFGKFIEEKDGYFFFEVTPKKETYEKFANILTNLMPLGGKELDNLKKDLENKINELSTQPIIIGYTPENSEYFKISNIAETMKAEKTAEGIFIQMKNNDIGDIATFKKTGENFSYTITDGEITNEFLNGTYSDEKLTFNIFSEKYDMEAGEYTIGKDAILVGNFAKANNVWSGEITSPELEDGKLIFTDWSTNLEKINGKISAEYEENIVGNINFSITSTKPDSVSISVPENVKTFKEGGEAIEKEMNALYSVPATPKTDAKRNDNEMNNDEMNNDTMNNDTMNDDENTTPAVPNPDTIPSVSPVIPTETTASETSSSASSENNTVKDTAEIEAVMKQMATMMKEAPTEESQKEFMKLAESADALAKKQNMSEEDMKALFQKVMAEQQ